MPLLALSTVPNVILFHKYTHIPIIHTIQFPFSVDQTTEVSFKDRKMATHGGNDKCKCYFCFPSPLPLSGLVMHVYEPAMTLAYLSTSHSSWGIQNVISRNGFSAAKVV